MNGGILEPEQRALLITLVNAWQKYSEPFRGTVGLSEWDWDNASFRHPGLEKKLIVVAKHDLDMLVSAGYLRISKPHGKGILPHEFLEVHFAPTIDGIEYAQASIPDSRRMTLQKKLGYWCHWIWNITNHQVFGAIVTVVLIALFTFVFAIIRGWL